MPRLGLAALFIVAAAAVAVLAWQGHRPATAPAPADGATAEEAAAIAASAGLTRREDARLILKTQTGEELALTDHEKCGDLPCPAEVATRYRYRGWDRDGAGYRLAVRLAPESAADQDMVLPFAGDPILYPSSSPRARAEAPLAQPAPPPPTASDDSLTDWLTGIAASRDQDEAADIAAAPGGARRDGATLAVALADGRHLALTDDLTCGQLACPPQLFRSFAYAGRTPDGRFHTVAENWDEMGSAFLVSAADGHLTRLLGLPKFSPDGKRAADAVASLEWSAPQRLEVWDLSGPTPRVVFQVAAEGEGDTLYEVVGWTDTDHARLRSGAWGTDARNDAMLVHDAAGWHIEASDGGD